MIRFGKVRLWLEYVLRPSQRMPAITKRACWAGLLLVFQSTSLHAQQPTPPPPSNRQLFTENDAYLGAAFTLATAALTPFDGRLARRLQQGDAQAHPRVHIAAGVVRVIAVPGSVIIGTSMFAVGRLSHHARLADLGLHGTEAIAAGGIVTELIKGTTGRSRPYVTNDSNPDDYQLFRGFARGRDYSSFPSGHVLAAFAAASEVTSEVGNWNKGSQWIAGPVLYGGAAAVAFSRLYDNQHWASDVILAAGIGTLAGTKVFRYQHRTHPGNHLDHWLLSGSISAGSDGRQHLLISPF